MRCTLALDAARHGYRPEIQPKRIKCNDNTREKRFSAFRGLSRMHTSPFGQESSAESAAGAGPPLISACQLTNPPLVRARGRGERKHSTCIASLIPAIPQIRAMARRWTSCALACVAVSAFAPRTALRPKTTIRRATTEVEDAPDIRWLAKLNPQQPDREPSGQNGTMVLPLFPLGAVAYTPGSTQVLNIFEPRYRKMYSDILMSGGRRFVTASSNCAQTRKEDHLPPSLLETTRLDASRRAPTAASRETTAGL